MLRAKRSTRVLLKELRHIRSQSNQHWRNGLETVAEKEIRLRKLHMKNILKRVFTKVECIRTLNKQKKLDLMHAAEEDTFKKEEFIYSKNKPIMHLHIVVEGRVALSESPTLDKLKSTFLEVGEYFGVSHGLIL